MSALKEYIRNADDLIVLINLRDIIVQGTHEPRVQESMWITNEILSYALDETGGRKVPRAAIVLSQADSYADTIKACGGALGVLQQYLPHVAYNYNWLDILVASAVDRILLDDNGNQVPAPDFQLQKLRVIMGWIRAGFKVAAQTSSVGPGAVLRFHCPHCYEKIEATGDMVGTEGECPTCGIRITVPPPASSPVSPPPPAQPRQPSPAVAQKPNNKGNGGESWWESIGGIVFAIYVICKFIKGCE